MLPLQCSVNIVIYNAPCLCLFHRRFILQSLGDTRQRLEQKQRGAREKISKIEEGVAYCKRAVKESEDSVRELVSQKKRA